MDELSLADYLAIIRRRKNWFLGTFLTLLAITCVGVAFWSNYRSTAIIEVVQPQVPSSITTPTTAATPIMGKESLADLRISRVKQKITSPASLVDVIEKLDLYPTRRMHEPMDVIAKDMAKKINLSLIGSAIANPAATHKVAPTDLSAIAFRFSFEHSDPETAQQVNNELVTRFIAEDRADRRRDAVATTEFVESQIKALEMSMAEQEKRIADFQNEHGISGPDALTFNRQAAASAALSLQNIDSQIAANEGSQGALRAQLSTVDPYSRVVADGQLLTTPNTQLKALEAQYATLSAQYGPDHPDIVRTGNQIKALRQDSGLGGPDTSALKARLRDVETNLAAAEKTKGPDSPDVASLRKQRESLATEISTARPSVSKRGPKNDADNPAYLALISQLDALGAQHKSLEAQRERVTTQQQKYEEAITRDPGLEQQMATLNRDHENAELRYRDLKERKLAADMELQMIDENKGEHLEVISPPDLPRTTYPSGILLFMGGLFLSALAGLAAVAAVQLLRQSVFGSNHLAKITGAAPLVAIPFIPRGSDEPRAQRARRLPQRPGVLPQGGV